MSRKIALEICGVLATNDEARESSLEDVVRDAMFEVVDALSLESIEDLDEIKTGINPDVTEAINTVVEEDDLDVEVDAFYPNVTENWLEGDFGEDEYEDYSEAWKDAYSWRNLKMAREDGMEAFVLVTDSNNGGHGYIADGAQKHVRGITLPHLTPRHADLDIAYGGGEADAEGDSTEAAA